jgi:hypothetical protein
VNRHRFEAEPDPNFHYMPIQIRIRTGIKTMPIHMRILPPSFAHVGKYEKKILLFTAMPVYNVFPFGTGKMMRIRPDPDPQQCSKPMLGLTTNCGENALGDEAIDEKSLRSAYGS